MTEYIPKSALVAEIEKWMTVLTKEKNQEGASKIDKLSLGGRIAQLQEVKVFLDTLEVKEVDLEKEIKEEYLGRRFYSGRNNMLVILNEPQFNAIAKHFFELGISVSNKAQKGE